MKKKLLIILLVCLGVELSFAQDYELTGPFGGDMRIRGSFGGIPDARYNNIKKIDELKSTKIAIGVSFPETLTYDYDNFWNNKISDHKINFKINDFVNTLIFSSISQSKYHFEMFQTEDIESLKILNSAWDGTLIISNKNKLKEISEKYNSEYLIVFIGGGYTNFMTMAALYLGSQGIYTREDSYMFLYAGHRIGIFNLKSGKQISRGLSVQASADVIPVKGKKTFEEFSINELDIFENKLETRLRNNISQSFKLLGIE
jgi:hypothetical protein